MDRRGAWFLQAMLRSQIAVSLSKEERVDWTTLMDCCFSDSVLSDTYGRDDLLSYPYLGGPSSVALSVLVLDHRLIVPQSYCERKMRGLCAS